MYVSMLCAPPLSHQILATPRLNDAAKSLAACFSRDLHVRSLRQTLLQCYWRCHGIANGPQNQFGPLRSKVYRIRKFHENWYITFRAMRLCTIKQTDKP